MEELRSGSLLQGGKYRIVKVLGQGGFGITYQAKMQTTVTGDIGAMDVEVDVAVKEFFIKERCVRNETTSHVSTPSESSREMVAQYRQKFIKEARNMASMNHPNIVKVTNVFEENGTVYYVMKFLPGGSLSSYVRSQAGGRLPQDEALRYVRQIGSALRYMHETSHTCHLDVKPGNVLLNERGEAVLIDFGLAKNYDASGQQTSSTPVGISKGYAPLEQYQQELTSFSPQTDVYSLGATLLFLLTGQTPPEASIINEEGMPPRPGTVEPALWNVIARAMQPRRRDRYASIAEMLEALSAASAADDEATAVTRPPVAAVAQAVVVPQRSTSRRWTMAVLAVVVGLAVAVGGWLAYRMLAGSGTVAAAKDEASSRYPFRNVGSCPLADEFNPMDGGIILGWTTLEEAVAAGGIEDKRDDHQHSVVVNGRRYWDHEGDGILTSNYITTTDTLCNRWLQAGMDFGRSYRQWQSWLTQKGFEVYEKETPHVEEGSLVGDLHAIYRATHLTLDLCFNYSGITGLDEPGTLFTMTMTRSRITTATSSWQPFFPVEGITPGVTTRAELEGMGLRISTFGDRNESFVAYLGEYSFYNDMDGGDVAMQFNVGNNLLPASWVGEGESRQMTYNLWMDFFDRNGCIVVENEPRNAPEEAYPELKAVKPELGLRFDVTFDSFDIAKDGDNPAVVKHYSVKVL